MFEKVRRSRPKSGSGIMKTRQGFTLIEFSLSVAFVGILSIAIALIINDTIAAYRRGMVLNQINTTGIDLVDDFRAAVQNSSISSVTNLCDVAYTAETIKKECKADNARNFTSVERLGRVNIRGVDTENVPLFGALCTGSYSYIWNSGYFFSDEAFVLDGVKAAYLQYKGPGGSDDIRYYPKNPEKSTFRLIKIKDSSRAVCMSATFGSYGADGSGQRYSVRNTDNMYNPKYDTMLINSSNTSNTNIFDLTKDKDTIYTFQELDEEDIVEVLIQDKGNNLVLYDLRSTAGAQNAAENGLFYSVSFILGTVQGGINVKASGNYCVPPEDYNEASYENFDYCAINKFNFAVQATGE